MSAFIEKMDLVRKIFKHQGLWDTKSRPKANPLPAEKLQYTMEDAILKADDMTIDPIYPAEANF